MSKLCAEYQAGKYKVTAYQLARRLPTFGIHIEEIGTDKYWRWHCDNWNHQSVQEVANAIAHLIGMPDISGEHYTPEWCKEHFT